MGAALEEVRGLFMKNPEGPKPATQPAKADDTVVVSTNETGVEFKRYRPYDPQFDWRNPPSTAEFGGAPIPAARRHKANSSTDLYTKWNQWHPNPYYDSDLPPSSVEEILRFEKVKEECRMMDFAGPTLWGTFFGLIPAMLFICGLKLSGLPVGAGCAVIGYLVTVWAAAYLFIPWMEDKWREVDVGRRYGTSEPFITSFFLGFGFYGSMVSVALFIVFILFARH